MAQPSIKDIALYQLRYDTGRTYIVASLLIVGNIVFPQLCHLLPQGGLILLPIYFFTLIGAYKYGVTVGLATAVLSPIVNHLLFGMPPAGTLPIILIKGTLLALAAAWMAGRTHRVTLLNVAMAVAAYQAFGSIAEWAMTNSLRAAVQDIVLGYPGIALQIVGGYLTLQFILKK